MDVLTNVLKKEKINEMFQTYREIYSDEPKVSNFIVSEFSQLGISKDIALEIADYLNRQWPSYAHSGKLDVLFGFAMRDTNNKIEDRKRVGSRKAAERTLPNQNPARSGNPLVDAVARSGHRSGNPLVDAVARSGQHRVSEPQQVPLPSPEELVEYARGLYNRGFQPVAIVNKITDTLQNEFPRATPSEIKNIASRAVSLLAEQLKRERSPRSREDVIAAEVAEARDDFGNFSMLRSLKKLGYSREDIESMPPEMAEEIVRKGQERGHPEDLRPKAKPTATRQTRAGEQIQTPRATAATVDNSRDDDEVARTKFNARMGRIDMEQAKEIIRRNKKVSNAPKWTGEEPSGFRMRGILNKGRGMLRSDARKIYKSDIRGLKGQVKSASRRYEKAQKDYKEALASLRALGEQEKKAVKAVSGSVNLPVEGVPVGASGRVEFQDRHAAIESAKAIIDEARVEMEQAREEFEKYGSTRVESVALNLLNQELVGAAEHVANTLSARYKLTRDEYAQLKPMLEGEASYLAQYYAKMAGSSIKLPTYWMRRTGYTAGNFKEGVGSLFSGGISLATGPMILGIGMLIVLFYFTGLFIGFSLGEMIYAPVGAGFFFLLGGALGKSNNGAVSSFISGAASMYIIILFIYILGLNAL